MPKKERPFYYGGQAVIEGVMMLGKNGYAVSCRKPNGEIVTKEAPVNTIKKKYPALGLPVIRGFVNLIEMLALGMKTITWSADQAGEEDEELGGFAMFVSIFLAVVLVVGIFFFLPTWAGTAAHPYIGDFGRSLLEGVIRITLFVLYIIAIRRMSDIRRVFEYHGAEHKTITCREHGEELTPENAAKYSTRHLRCGTSFLLLVMIVMIIIFTFVGQTQGTLWRVVIKLALMPVVAGITYEFTRWAAGHCEYRIVRLLMAPGLALQGLTTGQPDASQLEVAIHSLNVVMARDNGEEPPPPPRTYVKEEAPEPEIENEAAAAPAAQPLA